MLFQKIKKFFIRYWPFTFGLCSGIFFISLNVLGHDLSKLPGDLGDTRYCIYILEHFYQYIIGNVENYWGAPFMVPAQNVITYSENLLGIAPLFAIFRFSGINAETSFQLFYLLLVILNYTTCYMFLQYTFCNKYASVVGAMIFTFSMALQSQLEHAQTFPRFAIPLSFLFGLLFIRHFKPYHFILMCLAIVLQLYCSLYLGLMLLVPLALLFILSLLFQYKYYISNLLSIKWILSLLIGLTIPFYCLLKLLKPYIERADKVGYSSWQHVKENIPTIQSYFYSKHGSLLWDFLSETGNALPRWWNHQIFIGGLSIMFLLLFVYLGFKKLMSSDVKIIKVLQSPIAIISLAGVLTFLLYLKVGDFTLYKLIFHLPGYGSIRAVPRIINIELLFVALAGAYVIKLFFSKIKKMSWVFFVVVVTVFTIDNYYPKDAINNMPKESVEIRTDEMINTLSNLPKGTIFSYEPDTMILPAHVYHLDAMLAAQKLQLKTMNGYSGTVPFGYGLYAVKPNEKTRLRWIEKSGFSKELVIVK